MVQFCPLAKWAQIFLYKPGALAKSWTVVFSMNKTYFVKNPQLAVKYLFSNKIKPAVNNSVAGSYRTTNIAVPVISPKVDDLGPSYISKVLSGPPIPKAAIDPAFLRKGHQKGSGIDSNQVLENALSHPAKVIKSILFFYFNFYY